MNYNEITFDSGRLPPSPANGEAVVSLGFSLGSRKTREGKLYIGHYVIIKLLTGVLQSVFLLAFKKLFTS